MFVQVFSGWRYRPGVRGRLAEQRLGERPSGELRPNALGLLARLLATRTDDPDTGIGVWVWESEAACRDYEAMSLADTVARLEAEMDMSAMTETTFDALYFGRRID